MKKSKGGGSFGTLFKFSDLLPLKCSSEHKDKPCGVDTHGFLPFYMNV